MAAKTPRRRVLIADDTQFFRVMLGDLLNDEGFEVLTANDGEQAIEVVRHDYPTLSLVVLDLVMPKKDGAQVLREIKANPRTEGLPVIIVAGQEVTPERREELKAMGADGFVSKAMPSKELLFRVRSVVDEHATLDQASSEGVPVNAMVDYLTEQGTFSALCYRLSSQWIDLRTIHPLPEGSSLTLSFALPGSSEPLQLRGRVIEERRQPDEGASGRPAGMRVQFVSTHAGTLNEIRDFVQGKSHRS